MQGVLTEQTFADAVLTPKDAVFFLNGEQVKYLRSLGNPTLLSCSFISLSLHAHAEILHADPARIITHEAFADSRDIRRIREEAGRLDRSWLLELGHQLAIEGIDLADLDSLCQHHLFRHGLFIDLVARRLLEAHPEIERFFVILQPETLPQDYDFDSDVAAAILRFICESMSRKVVSIRSAEHLLAHGPLFLQRPYSIGWVDPYVLDPRLPDQHVWRIGFLPSTTPSGMRIIYDASSVNSRLMLFYSPWAVSAPRADAVPEDERITAGYAAWSAQIEAKLTSIWSDLPSKLDRSSLPDSIIRNPHLAFQFEYILTKRWLLLANLINRASRFVHMNPLDVFINPEIAIWEGVVLAALYRRQGAKILVAPHSAWPGTPFDASAKPTDWAMTQSRRGARVLRGQTGMSEIYVTGRPQMGAATSPGWEERMAERKRAVGARKLVLFVTNPAEISFLPSFDQKAHFAAIARLAAVPDHLGDKVLLACRRRSARGSEDNILYERRGGLQTGQLEFLDGLTFDECVAMADCVVGVTVQTSGYFDIVGRGKPLIHVQTLRTDDQFPEPPPEVIPAELLAQVADEGEIWPTIERVLFDDAFRQVLVEAQGRFVAEDLAPVFTGPESPIRSLLARMLLT